MKQKKIVTTEKQTVNPSGPMFEKDNFIWMLAGVIVMALGFVLMAGGRNDNPNVFNPDQVYSTTRITIAPIVILAGLTIEVFAIFRNPKKS